MANTKPGCTCVNDAPNEIHEKDCVFSYAFRKELAHDSMLRPTHVNAPVSTVISRAIAMARLGACAPCKDEDGVMQDPIVNVLNGIINAEGRIIVDGS